MKRFDGDLPAPSAIQPVKRIDVPPDHEKPVVLIGYTPRQEGEDRPGPALPLMAIGGHPEDQVELVRRYASETLPTPKGGLR